MTNSNVRDDLAAKHEQDRERRIDAIKRWVDYVRTQPPAVWGPQQNAVVNDQLDAADGQTTAVHQQRVADVATDIIEARDSPPGRSGRPGNE